MINEPPSKKDFGTQEWLLLLASVAILLIGIAFIYSARYTTESTYSSTEQVQARFTFRKAAAPIMFITMRTGQNR